MSKKKKIILSLLTIFLMAVGTFFVWLILPYPLCGDSTDRLLSYHSEKLRISFMYPSSLCVFEIDTGYPLELSRTEPPSAFYGNKEAYWKESWRQELGLPISPALFSGRIGLTFVNFSEKNVPASQVLKTIIKDSFGGGKNSQGVDYILEVFLQEKPKNYFYDEVTRVTLLSDRMKKAVLISQGPGITEEEFNVIVDSFRFEE